MTYSRKTRTELTRACRLIGLREKRARNLRRIRQGGPGGTDCDAVHLYKNVAWRAVIPDTTVCDRYHTWRAEEEKK
jgi:hypothetical protein